MLPESRFREVSAQNRLVGAEMCGQMGNAMGPALCTKKHACIEAWDVSLFVQAVSVKIRTTGTMCICNSMCISNIRWYARALQVTRREDLVKVMLWNQVLAQCDFSGFLLDLKVLEMVLSCYKIQTCSKEAGRYAYVVLPDVGEFLRTSLQDMEPRNINPKRVAGNTISPAHHGTYIDVFPCVLEQRNSEALR